MNRAGSQRRGASLYLTQLSAAAIDRYRRQD